MEKVFVEKHRGSDRLKQNIEIGHISFGIGVNLTDEYKKSAWVVFSADKAKQIREVLDKYIKKAEEQGRG